MNTPTIEDLQRLIPDAAGAARVERHNQAADGLARRALAVLTELVMSLEHPMAPWSSVRAIALRALYLCALVAWEAGRRMMVEVAPAEKPWPVGPWQKGPPPPAEAPAAKHDVEALLRDADDMLRGAPKVPLADMIRDLAAALRAERERHLDTARCLGESVAAHDEEYAKHLALRHEHGREKSSHSATRARLHRATDHLRAVLTHFTPDADIRAAREARAFLAGEAPPAVPSQDAPHVLRMQRDGWEGRARLAEAARDELKGRLVAEEEAHGHTRAGLAEIEREREWQKATRMMHPEGAQARIERMALDLRDALAAQNRAESEAAELRTELAALVAGIERIVAQMPKGRA